MPYTKKELENMEFWKKIQDANKKEYELFINREMENYIANPKNKPAKLLTGIDNSAILFEEPELINGNRTGLENIGQYKGITETVSKINLNEVDNVIDRDIEELISNRKNSYLTIPEFFKEYDRLRDDIIPVGDFNSHFYLIENSKLYLPNANVNEIDALKRALERETIEVMQIQSDLKEALDDIGRQQLILQQLQLELNQAILDALDVDLTIELDLTLPGEEKEEEENGEDKPDIPTGHTDHIWTPETSTELEGDKFTQTCYKGIVPHTQTATGTKKIPIQRTHALYLAEIGEQNKKLAGKEKLVPFSEYTWNDRNQPAGIYPQHAWSTLQFIENPKTIDRKTHYTFSIEWDRNKWVFRNAPNRQKITSFKLITSAMGASSGINNPEMLSFTWKLNGKNVDEIDGIDIVNLITADTTDASKTASKIISSTIQINITNLTSTKLSAFWWNILEGNYKCMIVDENGIAIDSSQYVTINFDESRLYDEYYDDRLGPS